jgi:hypothetical protein
MTCQHRKRLNSLPSSDGAERAVGAWEEASPFAAGENRSGVACQERQRIMKTQSQMTVPLGDLILTVFDKAAQYSLDPQEVSLLATQTVAHMLLRGRSLATPRPI